MTVKHFVLPPSPAPPPPSLFSGIAKFLCHSRYCFHSQSQTIFQIGADRPADRPVLPLCPHSLPDSLVQNFFRTELVFVILILRLLIFFQGQES